MNLNQKEIRWKQRFQNFKSAFMQLEAATALPKLNDLETSGLIQTFEYTFELAWKTLKDYLESEGINTSTPRQVIQESFKANIITNGHSWIDALEKRNLMAHTYNKNLSDQAAQLIKSQYFPLLRELFHTLEKKSL